MTRYRLDTTFLALFIAGSAFAADWRPINPAELAQKTPKVDPSADAEAIFWDVRIDDRLMGNDLSLSMSHYIRIKIFTDRGKEQYATVEIPRYGKRNIGEVAGRTIKPDGTAIDLKKDAIFDRQLVKTKGFKASGITFALPNVEKGDIIEYRYRETRDNETSSHMRLYFQRELPMWSVTYHVKPLNVPWLPYTMREMAFQCNPSFAKEPSDFFGASMTNVPAFKEEPNMPPEDQLRAWILIYYEEDKKIDAQKYWKEIGKQDYATFKTLTKADDQVKRTAVEITSSATTPADKLAVLDVFCRTKIRNLNSGAFHVTAEDRKSLKPNRSASDTLKQKAGSDIDVDTLFVAMANAAGFEARMARVPDRGDTFFSPKLPTTYFLHDFIVAVKLDDKWEFFDPSTPYLDRGMLRWQAEANQALVSDPKEGFFAVTQFSPPTLSKRERKAALKLLDDGAIEGTLSYAYTGHVARGQKDYYEEKTLAQIEEDWKRSLQDRLSTAELSDFHANDLADTGKPMVVTHKVNVPGYATRTGKRILLQPAFFEHNVGPRFPETTRKWDLYFDHGWAEEDDVTIELPEGWELDEPVAPQTSSLGGVGNYSVSVQKTKDGRKLFYHRSFDWGRGSNLIIPVANYPILKKVWDFVQEQDNYTISLKQIAKNAQ